MDSQTIMDDLPPINDGHYTTAIDRAYLMAEMVERALGDERIIQEVPHLKERYERIIEQLNELYQEIGLYVDEKCVE